MAVTNQAKRNKHRLKELQRKLRREAEGGRARSSQPKAPAQSLSHPSQADKKRLFEKLDGHAFLRNRLAEVARERGEWAGIPMPLDGETLVVEPRYPYAQALMAMKAKGDDGEKVQVRNEWYSPSKRCDIVLITTADGKVDWGYKRAFHSLPMALQTLGCADAWGIEQESNAVQLLGSLVDHRKFKQYMLTGMFLERSPRSGLMYLFRRLRPTVVIKAEPGASETRILCGLCMHPIAYYSGSWAGAMTPTDDVVAHLQMMRGDEAMFWRRSTQHPSWRPEAGL